MKIDVKVHIAKYERSTHIQPPPSVHSKFDPCSYITAVAYTNATRAFMCPKGQSSRRGSTQAQSSTSSGQIIARPRYSHLRKVSY